MNDTDDWVEEWIEIEDDLRIAREEALDEEIKDIEFRKFCGKYNLNPGMAQQILGAKQVSITKIKL